MMPAAVRARRSARSASRCRSNFATVGVDLDGLDRQTRQFQRCAGPSSGTTASTWNSGWRACERLGFERPPRAARTARPRARTRRGRTPAPARAASANDRAGSTCVAQHQSVDEHADQVVEGRVTTTGDRRADRRCPSVPRQPRQQHRQRGVHHHEQRGAVRAREPAQRRDARRGTIENGTVAPRVRRARRDAADQRAGPAGRAARRAPRVQ